MKTTWPRLALLPFLIGASFPVLAALDAATVKQTVASNFETYIHDHKTITEIESPTGNIEGSQKMADWVKQQFEALGYNVEFRKNEKGTHIIANKKGTGNLRVLLLGHTDTVQPVGSLEKQPYHHDVESGLVKGPGAGDSKASVAMLVAFAKSLNQLNFTNYAELTFYFDAEEEVGSDTESQILEELAKKHDLSLSVDSSPVGWGMTTQRKWVVNYEINVKGITGHAGNSAQSGASATVELANQITRIMQLASPLPEDPQNYSTEALEKRGIDDHGQFLPPVTINVGTLSTTNTKVNAIPADATAKLDVRGFKLAEQQEIDKKIHEIAASPSVKGTHVTVRSYNAMPAMEKTPQAAILVDAYKQIAKQQYGADIVEWAAGGVTIGNFTSHYIPTIDGLGVEVNDQHNLDKERAHLKTYEPRTVTMILLLDKVADQQLIKPQQ